MSGAIQARTGRRWVVVGVGNGDRRDDGVGLHVAHGVRAALARPWLPSGGAVGLQPWVEIRNLSGEATGLMGAWDRADGAIVIDAVQSGAAPGTVHRLDAAAGALPAWFGSVSTHSFGLAQAVELARVLGGLPPRLVVYGVEAGDVGYGTELSAAVAAAVADTVAAVVAELAGWVGTEDANGTKENE